MTAQATPASSPLKDPAELSARLGAYRDAGADHIMVQPEDRDTDDWMRTVEKIARAGSVH